MPSVSDTAYPRFKINPSTKELNELYTPTVHELAFARERARQPLQRAGLLLLLKTFQRLGYFAACAEIPAPIIRHVFRCAALVELPEQLQAYDERVIPVATAEHVRAAGPGFADCEGSMPH